MKGTLQGSAENPSDNNSKKNWKTVSPFKNLSYIYFFSLEN